MLVDIFVQTPAAHRALLSTQVCVCVCVRERERESVCVCEREKEREGERERVLVCFHGAYTVEIGIHLMVRRIDSTMSMHKEDAPQNA